MSQATCPDAVRVAWALRLAATQAAGHPSQRRRILAEPAQDHSPSLDHGVHRGNGGRQRSERRPAARRLPARPRRGRHRRRASRRSGIAKSPSSAWARAERRRAVGAGKRHQHGPSRPGDSTMRAGGQTTLSGKTKGSSSRVRCCRIRCRHCTVDARAPGLPEHHGGSASSPRSPIAMPPQTTRTTNRRCADDVARRGRGGAHRIRNASSTTRASSRVLQEGDGIEDRGGSSTRRQRSSSAATRARPRAPRKSPLRARTLSSSARASAGAFPSRHGLVIGAPLPLLRDSPCDHLCHRVEPLDRPERGEQTSPTRPDGGRATVRGRGRPAGHRAEATTPAPRRRRSAAEDAAGSSIGRGRQGPRRPRGVDSDGRQPPHERDAGRPGPHRARFVARWRLRPVGGRRPGHRGAGAGRPAPRTARTRRRARPRPTATRHSTAR